MNRNQLISESFPDAIDFGFCTVGQNNVRTFTLKNTTTRPANFHFDSSSFYFEPQKSTIQPRSSIEISISFRPQEAIVVVANAVLYVNDEPPRVTKLSAIGKYPYINLSASKLDFENLLIGKKSTKDLVIKNLSQVPAKFEIRKLPEDSFKDDSFSFDLRTGEIAPQASFLVKVVYEPKIVFLDSVVHFEVVCFGGNNIPFNCRGCAIGFDVNLSSETLIFGEILKDDSTSRELTIHNNSQLPTSFQFFNDPKNIFGFSLTSGYINAASKVRIKITFQPKVVMNYYERVFCLISNHQVLYIDLIGTCYDLLIRPKPVLQNHINVFRRRVIEGKYNKEDLVIVRPNQTERKDRLTFASSQSRNPYVMISEASVDRANDSIMELPIENPSQVVLHKELFQELSSPNKLISISSQYLDFGFCSPLTLSQKLEFEVTNNLDYPITLYWIEQKELSQLGGYLSVFNIHPPIEKIKKGETKSFGVTFRPTKGASYFFQNLQYFAVRNDPIQKDNLFKADKKKTNKNIMSQYNTTLNASASQDLIIEDEIQPPISGYIPCVGHSFSISSQTFIPIINVSPSNKIDFRPCSVGENVYATVQLNNQTDTPVYYKFGYDTSKVFRAYPPCGIIDGKSFNVVCFEFSPNQSGTKTYTHAISCSLNHNLSDQIIFKLYGYCFEPKLELPNNGELTFPPSYTGVISKQKVKIHNTSRVPLEYRIDVPKKYENELYLEPSTSILKPNEIKYLLSSFIPYRKKTYKISVPIHVFNVVDPLQSLVGYYLPGSGKNVPVPARFETEYKLSVTGVGGDGSLSIAPKELDFGIVKVNFSKRLSFVIENFSEVTFYVEIRLNPKNDKLSPEVKKTIINSFKLEFEHGKIAGSSKLEIGITFLPLDIFKCDVDLECIATERNPKSTTKGPKIYSEKCSLNIRAEGSYPKLKFVDVRNDSISVSTLWENFSINTINNELLENLDEEERKYNKIEQLKFEEAQRLQKRLKCFPWNFGYLSNKQPIKPRKVVITIQNIGGTDLKWKFQFPSDDYVSTEPWADPGEPTEEEAFEKAMIEKKIFEVKPREGELKAGGLCDIELFYSPSFDDRPSKNGSNRTSNENHFLRVVFQIINGKPITLELSGTTLAPLKGLLAIRKTNYTLPPVPIGSLLPAYYPIEIQNVGTGKITYRVDTEALNTYTDEKIKVTSKLLDVKESNKTLNANEKSYLHCLFKPLEAKRYEFKLPIEVSDFIEVIHKIDLTLTGQGYNIRPPRDELGNKEEIPMQRSFVSSLGSMVFFSIEELDFGEVESQKPQYRLLLLYNASKTRSLSYEVFTYGLECEDTLSIDPRKKERVEPESFVQLKVTLIPSIIPSFYEGEIEFSITWLNDDEPREPTVSSYVKNENEQKELLFLRIKKKSKFLDEKKKFIPLEQITSTEHKEDKHLFEIVLSKVINDVLNDPGTDDMLSKSLKLPIQLYDQFDSEEPANIHRVSPGLEDKIVKNGADASDFRNMFFLDEFTEMVDVIMENTFFNVIQHATLKEIDLLKPSKIYLTPI